MISASLQPGLQSPAGKIKAVVFDMDGVLIDAREWHYEALNKALRLFGFEISRYDHLVTFDGLPTKTKLRMLSREKNLPDGLHGFINDLKQQYTLEMTYTQCKPKFNHRYALSHLRAQGYRLGVASNSVRKSVELMMEKSGLDVYLDFMLSNQDVERSKPAPDIYLAAAARFGCTPAEMIVVEDNEHGIAAGKAAGCPVLAVADPDSVTLEAIAGFIRKVEAGSA